MPDGRAKVVIVGAGFGGIEAAKSLRGAPVEVVVAGQGPRPEEVGVRLLGACKPGRRRDHDQRHALGAVARERAVERRPHLVERDDREARRGTVVTAHGA